MQTFQTTIVLSNLKRRFWSFELLQKINQNHSPEFPGGCSHIFNNKPSRQCVHDSNDFCCCCAIPDCRTPAAVALEKKNIFVAQRGNAIVLQHFENIASVLGNGKLAGVVNSVQTCLLAMAANTFLFETFQSGACFGCTAGFSLEVFQAGVRSHQVLPACYLDDFRFQWPHQVLVLNPVPETVVRRHPWLWTLGVAKLGQPLNK